LTSWAGRRREGCADDRLPRKRHRRHHRLAIRVLEQQDDLVVAARDSRQPATSTRAWVIDHDHAAVQRGNQVLNLIFEHARMVPRAADAQPVSSLGACSRWMEVISGTTASAPRGWSWSATGDPIALEPGGVDLNCRVTILAGAPIERMQLVEGEPQGAWRLYDVGESFDVAGGERVLLRPRGSSGASCTFAWSGAALDALGQYRGERGSTTSWR
jgi:hypothetical protein